MRNGQTAVVSWVGIIALLALFGCGESPAPRTGSAEKSPKVETGPKSYDVKVASAESKLAEKDKASPAAEPAARDTQSEPASLPGAGAKSPAAAPLAAAPVDEIGAAQLTMPQVSLSQAHSATCKVHVGEQFPDLQLDDLAGKKQSVAQMLGPKLTVVAFWNGQHPTALEELKDLEPQVARRFASQGVTVIGINSGDDKQLAAELTKHAGASFANLSDADGKALLQVATARVPRTYLLDASGKVLWLDLEYSRTTRRELSQAIRFVLAGR